MPYFPPSSQQPTCLRQPPLALTTPSKPTRRPQRDLPLAKPSTRTSTLPPSTFGPSIQPHFPTVHAAFRHHALRQPHTIALHDLPSSRTITYESLLALSSHLARQLRTLGISRGSRVPILAKRSPELIVGILGVLIAGAQYVPLDGGVVPDASLKHVVRECNGVVLCSEQFRERTDGIGAVTEGSVAVVVLEDSWRECEWGLSAGRDITGDASETGDDVTDEDGCYIVYTSGTTGTPKGVDVSHGNVTNLLCTRPGNVGMRPGMRVGQVLSITFDMGAWEMLGAMCNGCTLVLRGNDWEKCLKEIDVLICTPTVLSRFNPAKFPNIKFVATAGEPCPQRLADSWATHDRTFYNSCGPTEVTIVDTMHKHTYGTPLSIGRPTPNNSVYILDDNMQPVQIGELGIMWAGGKGITRGYVGLPEKTKEKWRLDPWMGDGSMMFNTGDLARWREDGNIEMLGRMDEQVKIKGFRVELDGVSAALLSCPGVTAAVALSIGEELWGFVCPRTAITDVMRAHLARLQPYYAIPSRFHLLDELPMTANGKVSKRDLKALVTMETLKDDIVVTVRSIRSSSSSVTSGSVTELQDDADTTNPSQMTLVDEEKHMFEKEILAAGTEILAVEKETLALEKMHGLAPETADLEKGEEFDLSAPIPDKALPKPVRGLRHRIFIVYRRLFSLFWLANIVVLALFLIFPIDRQYISTVALTNLAIAVLVRNDTVINILYTITCSVPPSWPLWIRTRCAKIYHLGGLHSGAATSAVAWFTGAVIYSTFVASKGANVSPATTTTSFITLTLLLSVLGFAHPDFRKKFHNRFELIHRFGGWSALTLAWSQAFLVARDTARAAQIPYSMACLYAPNLWLLTVIILSIACSWFTLRKVDVNAEVLSDHAVQLHFDYVTPVNGTFTRLSVNPLVEWHSFATIPLAESQRTEKRPNGYSLIVSKAGDWTGSRISQPPKKLWVRGVPACGVMRIATLFNRLVVVGTGSGIGPLLGFIQASPIPCRVIWSTPNPEKTFGKAIIDDVRRADPDCIIWNTRTMGRPDLVKMSFNLAKDFQAEAVCIIANEKITKKVVYGLETRGIPAYGAIWDS